MDNDFYEVNLTSEELRKDILTLHKLLQDARQHIVDLSLRVMHLEQAHSNPARRGHERRF